MSGIAMGRCRIGRSSALTVAGALAASMLVALALAQAPQNGARHPRSIMSFSVGPDQDLVYPGDLPALPDEHTTFLPIRPGSGTYLVFAASMRGRGPAGTVVLQTSDLKTFTYAADYKSPVMVPPVNFLGCNPAHDSEFDESYSAPGSVVQDPTRPAGNLIMIYQAENHCPGGVWQRQFYATVGLARSTDFGKTWPAPIDGEFGGRDRRPVLKMAAAEPTAHETSPIYMGNAIPSAFVDTNDKGEHYIYVPYIFAGQGANGYQRMARARLEDDDPGSNDPARRLTFTKWYKGAFSEPGIGGLDGGVTPGRGCTGGQNQSQISYNDAIEQYLLTFVCVSLQGQPGNFKPYQAAWYYSTATSLELQNWTMPQLIQNSQFPVTTGCAYDGSGRSFDGWYPSFVSPNHAEGRLGENGQVFFMSGCETQKRRFMSRTFTISIGPN
jgi:hypothetical protein